MRFQWSLALCVLSGSLALAAPARAADWEQISSDDGIVVWQRKVEGTSLVEFRGRGKVHVDFRKILAVLHDTRRKTEWLDSCVEFRRLELQGPGSSVVYHRTGSSFPLVSDRDVVLQSSVDVWRDKKQIRVEAVSTEHPAAPPVDGVVRMPNLKASWLLIAHGPSETEVTYQVQADPGGSLPAWVVNLVAKKIPFKTIGNLRRQVQKPGYDAELAYVNSAFDWSGFHAEGGGSHAQGTAAP
jgi:hypothetical protein